MGRLAMKTSSWFDAVALLIIALMSIVAGIATDTTAADALPPQGGAAVALHLHPRAGTPIIGVEPIEGVPCLSSLFDRTDVCTTG
jgi:hypothetical protein